MKYIIDTNKVYENMIEKSFTILQDDSEEATAEALDFIKMHKDFMEMVRKYGEMCI